MALSAADSKATFDETTGLLDISPVLSALLLKDTTILGVIGWGEPCKKIVFDWNSDVLNSNYVTLNNGAAVAAGDTSIVITDATKVRVGTLLSDFSVGKQEVVQVTAISSNTLTITRAYGSTTAEAHADSTNWLIVGQPVQMGDETITDISRNRTQEFNHAQGFKRTVKVSDEIIAETRNGMHPGVMDEFELQIQRRLAEMMVEFNTAVIHGQRSGTPSDTVYATMGGLKSFIDVSGGNVQTSQVDFNEKYVNDLYQLPWNLGGDPGHLVMPADVFRRFGEMNQLLVRYAPSDRVHGQFVTKFLTNLGRELELHAERWMRSGEVFLLDVEGRAQGQVGRGVELVQMTNRELVVEPLAKVGSARRGQVVGNWSLRVRHGKKIHAIGKSFTMPSAPAALPAA